jgi:hypothetical protein
LLVRACINGTLGTPTGLFLKVVDFLMAAGTRMNDRARDVEQIAEAAKKPEQVFNPQPGNLTAASGKSSAESDIELNPGAAFLPS